VFDVYQTVFFGLFGYLCSKLRLEPAPMLIGFVLGPMMEEHLRRAMLLSRGNPMVFIERPISATMLAIGTFALALMLLPSLRKGKDKALAEYAQAPCFTKPAAEGNLRGVFMCGVWRWICNSRAVSPWSPAPRPAAGGPSPASRPKRPRSGRKKRP
jgi:hypothetical protein